MANEDYTVNIEDKRIFFITSYRDEFGDKRIVENCISKERLIEIRENINVALARLQDCSMHTCSGCVFYLKCFPDPITQ